MPESTSKSKIEYEAVSSRYPLNSVGDKEWRVEGIDYENEGICYLAIFPGHKTEELAKEYADFKNKQS